MGTDCCPHVESNPISTRSELLQFLAQVRDANVTDGLYRCIDCDKPMPSSELRVCLHCAPNDIVRCGRYHQGHGLLHFEATGHNLCCNLQSTAVWCYSCDKEVFLIDDDTPNCETSNSRSQSPDSAVGRNFPNPIAEFKNRQGYVEDDSFIFSNNVSGGRSGLVNLGNTCFLNSGIQALIHIPQIIDVFAQKNLVNKFLVRTSNHETLRIYFADLVRKIWEGQYRVFAPRDVVQSISVINPVFRGYDQQDTQEFIRSLIDSLHESMKVFIPPKKHSDGVKRRPTEVSLVTDLFQGLLLSQVSCELCGNVSEVYDPFMDLSLEIPTKQQLKKLSDQENDFRFGSSSSLLSMLLPFGWGTSIISLETCLHSFCSMESLVRLDQYNCDKCHKKVNASKVLSIGRCPEILSLHIKRFAHNSYWGSKLNTFVEFPLRGLDMSSFVKKAPSQDVAPANHQTESFIYDLTSVVKHMGSVHGGHYVAYAKHHLSRKWFEFDDREVTEVSEDTVKTQEAYILIYTKTSSISRKANDQFFEQTLLLKDDLPQVFLSLYWLKKAELFLHPGPIINWSLYCEHGTILPVEQIKSRALPISRTAWDTLHGRFGGGPMLTVDPSADGRSQTGSECLECRRKLESSRISMLDDESQLSHPIYFVSEQWIKSWRVFMEGGPLPSSIDNSVLLEADGLTPKPDLVSLRHYRPVGYPVWKEFVRLYGGGPPIERNSENIYEGIHVNSANLSTADDGDRPNETNINK